MITIATARKLILAMDGILEKPHFNTVSFRFRNKILLTLDEEKQRACVKLTPEDQDVFCLVDKQIIYPVPNKWGVQGWTFVELRLVPRAMFVNILKVAHQEFSNSK